MKSAASLEFPQHKAYFKQLKENVKSWSGEIEASIEDLGKLNHGFTSSSEISKQADSFLKKQKNRLDDIEDCLIHRIEEMLPTDYNQMTASEILQLSQTSLRLVDTILEASLHETPLETQIHPVNDLSDRTQKLNRTRLSTAHTLPLASVAEAEYETDATNTPASNITTFSRSNSITTKVQERAPPAFGERTTPSTVTIPIRDVSDVAADLNEVSALYDEDELEDESLSLAPTVKGHGYYKKIMQNRDYQSNNTCPIPELTLDVDPSSPGHHLDHSVLTYDHATRPDIHVDESLLVTPVLMRYRLEPDDTSVGVKVVPNRRGLGVKRFATNTSAGNYHAEPQDEAPPSKASFDCLTVNTELGEDLQPQNDEILSPNVSVRKARRPKRHPFDAVNETETNFYPALALPFETTAEKHEIFNSLVQRRQSEMAATKIVPEKIRLAHVSISEYESAPSVVRMQVTHSEVFQVVTALNRWFHLKDPSDENSFRLTETEAVEVVGLDTRKTKSLMMSLCHWRRMNMFLDGEMYFSPNLKFSSTSRMTL